jgi:uncharacterized NAD(P)/FAD-binding protein YdhS
MTTPRPYDLALIGDGFAACVAVGHLARTAPAGTRLAIISRGQGQGLGKGLAYQTSHPHHLLNVRACRMSVDTCNDLDFVNWADTADPDKFMPRSTYGEYLADRFERALSTARDRNITVDIVSGSGSDLGLQSGLYRVTVNTAPEATPVQARAILLCEGPAHLNPLCDAGRRWIDPVWPSGLEQFELQCGSAIILGTGLTAIDVALSLLSVRACAHIQMISLDGALPEPHEGAPSKQCLADLDFQGLSPAQTLLTLRRSRTHTDWRQGVDALRPHLNALWQDWTDSQRRSAHRRLAHIWNRHRHRAPQETLARLASAMQEGRLHLRRGHVQAITCTRDRVEVHTRDDMLTADLGIDARGFGRIDARSTTLVGVAIRKRWITACEQFGGVIADASGLASHPGMPLIYVVGAARLGPLVETTGAPEVKAQTLAAMNDWTRRRADIKTEGVS